MEMLSTDALLCKCYLSALDTGDGMKEPTQTVVVASRTSCTRNFLSLVTDFVIFLCGIFKPIICKCFRIQVLL